MTHLATSIKFAEKTIAWNDAQLRFIAETMANNEGNFRDLKFWRKMRAWHIKNRQEWLTTLAKYQAAEAREK